MEEVRIARLLSAGGQVCRRTCCPGIIDGCAVPPVVLRACCVRLLDSGRWSLGGCACQPRGAATFIVELGGDGAALALMPPPSIGRRPPRGVPGPTAGRPGVSVAWCRAVSGGEAPQGAARAPVPAADDEVASRAQGERRPAWP